MLSCLSVADYMIHVELPRVWFSVLGTIQSFEKTQICLSEYTLQYTHSLAITGQENEISTKNSVEGLIEN